VHAVDKLTIRENLQSLGHLGTSIDKLFGCKAVISPIALSPRLNPNVADASKDENLVSLKVHDARQSIGFGAAWTVGALSQLVAAPAFESLTFGDAFGPNGVMHPCGKRCPVFKVFEAIQSCSNIHQTLSAFSLNIAALGMTHNDGTRSVLLANMSESSQTIAIEISDGVRLQFHLEPESVRIQGNYPEIICGFAKRRMDF